MSGIASEKGGAGEFFDFSTFLIRELLKNIIIRIDPLPNRFILALNSSMEVALDPRHSLKLFLRDPVSN